MNNQEPLIYQMSTESYGNVRAIPLLLANELNTKLEQWFQNCKFMYLAIHHLPRSEYEKPLQLEHIYSLRTLKLRNFSEVASEVTAEIDLINFHQLVKVIHEYIESAYKIYAALNEKKVPGTILDFEEHIKKICKAFHKKNFPDKLENISSMLGINNSLNNLNQINRVRNCLEHRGGIVSKEDCDASKNYMSIKFRFLRVESSAGEITPISNIEGRLNSVTNFVSEEKKFRIGERVSFDFHDNSKLIHSINFCFKTIIDGIYSSLGINQENSLVLVREFNV